MNKTKIEWTDYTWNPVTGCKNDCFYCYGRALNKRFGKDYKPRIWWDKLEEPAKKRKPSKIFVCSMADLFGDWIPSDTIDYVLDTVRKCPQHTFQFLTKNAKRYQEFKFPSNCWLGETVTHFKTAPYGVSPYAGNQGNIRFVSFEPLMTEMKISYLHPFDWIIIGAMTGAGSKEHQPKIGWIASILNQAKRSKTPVFMKNNLKSIWKGKLWKGKLRQEFPNETNILR